MAAGFKSALEFLKKVKKVYGAESLQYQGFIDALKDFKAGSADTREATRRIIALFQGHPELIEGYAAFLPPGATIQLPADPQGNIIVTVTTGIMEIAQDGTVVTETHTQAPECQDVAIELPELAEPEQRLLENLRARVADSGEHAKYETFVASFETYLRMTPEQRKASLGVDQGYEFAEKFKELLGDDESKQALSTVLN